MAIDVTLEIKTFFRESTSEWVGEIEYATKDSSGTIRYARETEQAAIAAMYSDLGKVLSNRLTMKALILNFNAPNAEAGSNWPPTEPTKTTEAHCGQLSERAPC